MKWNPNVASTLSAGFVVLCQKFLLNAWRLMMVKSEHSDSVVFASCTYLGWMEALLRGTLTLECLKSYCEWLREEVLKADREVTPEIWRTDFDYFRGYVSGIELEARMGSMSQAEAISRNQICLCMAASDGTLAFLNRRMLKAEIWAITESSFVFDERQLISDCLGELNGKLREIAEHPFLLPNEGLLFYKHADCANATIPAE